VAKNVPPENKVAQQTVTGLRKCRQDSGQSGARYHHSNACRLRSRSLDRETSTPQGGGLCVDGAMGIICMMTQLIGVTGYVIPDFFAWL